MAVILKGLPVFAVPTSHAQRSGRRYPNRLPIGSHSQALLSWLVRTGLTNAGALDQPKRMCALAHPQRVASPEGAVEMCHNRPQLCKPEYSQPPC